MSLRIVGMLEMLERRRKKVKRDRAKCYCGLNKLGVKLIDAEKRNAKYRKREERKRKSALLKSKKSDEESEVIKYCKKNIRMQNLKKKSSSRENYLPADI